jgi:hypothetical protein
VFRRLSPSPSSGVDGLSRPHILFIPLIALLEQWGREKEVAENSERICEKGNSWEN